MLNSEEVERLAQAIHEHYRASWLALQDRAGDAPTSSRLAGVEWADLSEADRVRNRRQARHIEHKLLDADLELCDLDHPDVGSLTSTRDQLTWESGDTVVTLDVEDLARVEHDRWMRDKIDAGWIYGDTRSDSLKHHPLIRPWDGDDERVGLSDAQRELDREPVRSIPRYLDIARLGVRLDGG